MFNQPKNLESIVIKALLFVVLAWLVNAAFILIFESVEKSAQFGDTFGPINALFSGLAFVGLIYAILLQRQDIKIQSQELKATVEEFKVQNETLKKQQFETTFFNMLSLHNEIVMSTALGPSKGREMHPIMYAKIKNSFANNRENKNTEEIVSNYLGSSYQAQLGHYFRNLYRIFKFVDESNILDKKFYTDIIRAQLSNSELLLLFYNCYFYERGKNFAKYAEKYELFDNLPINQLIKPEHEDKLK